MAEKRKFDLSKDIIKLDREEEEGISLSKSGIPEESLNKIQKERIYLSLCVTEKFKKEYKIWCAQKGLKQNEAIIKIFDKIKSLEDF